MLTVWYNLGLSIKWVLFCPSRVSMLIRCIKPCIKTDSFREFTNNKKVQQQNFVPNYGRNLVIIFSLAEEP